MSPSARKEAKLAVGGPPRADLLPPEVKEEKVAKAQRRRLFGIVMLVIIAVGAGYALASVTAATSQLMLEIENERTAALLAEQTQFSEVRSLRSQVDSAKSAETILLETEIDWNEYLSLVEGTLPPGAMIETAAVISSTTTAPLGAPSNILQGQRVAEVLITVRSATSLDVATWMENLSEIRGFAGVIPNTVTREISGGYTSTVLLQLNEEAYALRFATEETE
jgi:hypothetical protein